MRVLTIALAGFALMSVAAVAQGQAPLKIGYVNSAVILEQAPGAKEASDQFNQYLQSTQAQVERMGDSLQVLIQNFERQQIALSPQAKTARETEIRQKQQEMQARVDQLEQQAGQRQKELVQPVMDRVNREIEALAKEGGYSYIFDAAAGSIIFADPSLDLTEEVLRRLRAQTGGR
jgi:outer membrane protein